MKKKVALSISLSTFRAIAELRYMFLAIGCFLAGSPETDLCRSFPFFESIFVGKRLRPHDVNQTHGMYFTRGQ